MELLIHNLQIQKSNSTYVTNYNIAGVNRSSQNFESATEEWCGVLNNSYYGNKVYDTRNFESMAYIYFPKPTNVDLSKKKIVQAKLQMKTTSQLESGFQPDGSTIYQVNAQYFVANLNICGANTNTAATINYLNKSDQVNLVGTGGWLKSNFCNIGETINPSISSLDAVRQGFEYEYLVCQMYAAYYKSTMEVNYWPYFSKTKEHVLDLYYEDVIPIIGTEFPVDINIKNTIDHIFTWSYSEDVNVGQKSFDIEWSTDGESWSATHVESENHYHTFVANTFPAGSIQWRVKVTNNDDQVSDYSYGAFNAIGVTDAPDNITVTNDAKPTISWTVDNQDAFEIVIVEKGVNKYVSDMVVGSNARSYQIPIVLENGTYIASVRVLNQFGIYTDWTSASFVINKTAPTAPEAFISYTDDYAVSIKSNDAGELYVLRKKSVDSKFESIGALIGEFKDVTCLNGESYDYVVRKYSDGGIADSKAVTMTVNYSGLLIYCNDMFARIWITSDESMYLKARIGLNKFTKYSRTVGRKYPIRETNEWRNQSLDISGYIYKSDKDSIEKMDDDNSTLFIKHDCNGFYADIVSVNMSNSMFNKGYDLDMSFVRVDEGSE